MNVRTIRMLRESPIVNVDSGRVIMTNEEIKKFLDNLPDDIKKYIYVNFFELELKFSTVINYMMIDCQHLNRESTKKLKKYVKIIINNKKLKEMFLEKSSSFKGTYNYLKYNGTIFDIAKDDPYYNFALSWTLHQHH